MGSSTGTACFFGAVLRLLFFCVFVVGYGCLCFLCFGGRGLWRAPARLLLRRRRVAHGAWRSSSKHYSPVVVRDVHGAGAILRAAQLLLQRAARALFLFCVVAREAAARGELAAAATKKRRVSVSARTSNEFCYANNLHGRAAGLRAAFPPGLFRAVAISHLSQASLLLPHYSHLALGGARGGRDQQKHGNKTL